MINMRYRSLVTVDFVIIDVRKDFDQMRHIIPPALIAVQMHFPYHIVFLCDSIQNADKIDLLGEQSGQELFFHGEFTEDPEEVTDLLRHSKAIFISDFRWQEASHICGMRGDTIPTIQVLKHCARYFSEGIDSDHYIEMSLMECFNFLWKRKRDTESD